MLLYIGSNSFAASVLVFIIVILFVNNNSVTLNIVKRITQEASSANKIKYNYHICKIKKCFLTLPP